ncbi:helix-turn-helix transcriptional regulator [Bradyrhizobium sp. 177]|uniref:helix-turn-helix transcriptional regulator n=1 Tax=Bradyrhizobium sp. 177 TaxID=2782647 RepID=UPI003211B9AD
MDDGSVAALPDRLGVSSRHLARLFERYVGGASPQQVAKTRRVQRAKRLIDETNDRLAQIAHRAGFGSVRRFNAAFRELYGLSVQHSPSPQSIRVRQASPALVSFWPLSR